MSVVGVYSALEVSARPDEFRVTVNVPRGAFALMALPIGSALELVLPGAADDPVIATAREIERAQLMEQVRLLNAACAHWEQEYSKSGREQSALETRLADAIQSRDVEWERAQTARADAATLRRRLGETNRRTAELIVRLLRLPVGSMDNCSNTQVRELIDKYFPGVVHGSAGTESGEIEAATIGVTRAGLEPATYGLKGPASNAGDTPTDADTTGSIGDSTGDERRSAPENGATSPEMSPDDDHKPFGVRIECQVAPHIPFGEAWFIDQYGTVIGKIVGVRP